MPMKGPAPKMERSRPNDTARREAEFSTVVNDDLVRGPELPESVVWHPMTVRWWDTWRRSAQAKTFSETDWDFLLDTARLHSELWAGQLGVAPELRLRVSKFGASPEDRMRLRLKIDEDAQKAVEPEQSLSADRKARLRAVVND
jgi:hypothetical protein